MKKEARLENLKKMKKEMKEKMMDGRDFSDVKKVTVMSDSEEGLEEGLSKAEQILKKREEYGEGGKGYREGGYGDGKGEKYQDDGVDFEHKAPLKGGYTFQNPGLRKEAKKFAKKKK